MPGRSVKVKRNPVDAAPHVHDEPLLLVHLHRSSVGTLHAQPHLTRAASLRGVHRGPQHVPAEPAASHLRINRDFRNLDCHGPGRIREEPDAGTLLVPRRDQARAAS